MELWELTKGYLQTDSGDMSRLTYLVNACSSCDTIEDSLCKQATASCGGGGRPIGAVPCMVLGSKLSALNTSRLKRDRNK